jgi:hypothetical protein
MIPHEKKNYEVLADKYLNTTLNGWNRLGGGQLDDDMCIDQFLRY